MFGLSFGEILIIAVLALLLLGPDKLPDAAKTLGKGLREIRKATEDLKDQVEREIYADEGKKARPALVPPVPAAPVPGPAGPPPPATSENVPGLEAALAEPPGSEPPPPPEGTAAGLSEPPPPLPEGVAAADAEPAGTAPAPPASAAPAAPVAGGAKA